MGKSLHLQSLQKPTCKRLVVKGGFKKVFTQERLNINPFQTFNLFVKTFDSNVQFSFLFLGERNAQSSKCIQNFGERCRWMIERHIGPLRLIA